MLNSIYKNIGLIGKGFVGNAVKKWFDQFHPIPFVTKNSGDFDKVAQKKYIFMCLPTPFNRKNGYDISILDENIKKLPNQKYIIIKSTVLPGTTKMFAEKYPQHNFFFNPEFLREKTALEDFFKPDRQIVGFADKSHKITATYILETLPRADFYKICHSSEAEMAKLVNNCFLASKVVFANEIYDYCEKTGVDYDEMIKMVKADKRIGESHWKIHCDHGKSGRGYGGHCFPKDMSAVEWDSNSHFIKIMNELNKKILKK